MLRKPKEVHELNKKLLFYSFSFLIAVVVDLWTTVELQDKVAVSITLFILNNSTIQMLLFSFPIKMSVLAL